MPRRQKRLASDLEQRDNLANAAVHKVQVEIMSWLTRHVGGVGSGRIFFDQEFTPGESLKAVLTRLGHRFPELGREIWNPETGEIWEFVEIIVNDAFLGIHHTMDSPIKEGDRITLMEAFEGG